MPLPFVLYLSADFDLRETRRRVLLTRYSTVALGSTAMMKALPDGTRVDLLVLCHTLAAEEANGAMLFARACWPGVKVLAISAPYANGVRGKADAVVGGLAGPHAMFQAISQLLPGAGASQA